MLDLQGIVQALGRVGQGKFWVVVTSQEKLNELVGGLDDSRVELARLMDRFPLQVHLEPSDISEVTSKRVLAKTADAEKQLAALFEAIVAASPPTQHYQPTSSLPQISRENFIELYPMVPYQVDFVIHVVSGLRTQGGASRHVGGANRTVIKLAQQLLAHPKVGLGEQEVGQLVTVEHIYDLVRDNIDSTIRDKIDRLATEVEHPFAQRVAKSICLLQFVKSIHRNAENIAATLYPRVGGDSVRASVDQALQALVEAHKIRLGDDGYRIPTPTEDDWETQRAALKPKRADTNSDSSRDDGKAVAAAAQLTRCSTPESSKAACSSTVVNESRATFNSRSVWPKTTTKTTNDSATNSASKARPNAKRSFG